MNKADKEIHKQTSAFMRGPNAKAYFTLVTRVIVAEASGASTAAFYVLIEKIEAHNRAQGMGYPASAKLWETTYTFAGEVLAGKHPA